MTPSLRIPVLEWAVRASDGRTEDLSWVDTTIYGPGTTAFACRTDDEGTVTFRHVPYGQFLPPPMLQAAQEDQHAGHATALEALILLFARHEWQVASRHLLWTAATPSPLLLAPLVEAYGIHAELHGFDPSVLAILVTRLPAWYPHRGDAHRAADLLTDVLDTDPPPVGDDPALPELFACRSSAWWQRRDTSAGVMRIEDGVLRVAATDRPRADVADVLVRLHPSAPPVELLRLLPAWATVRLLARDTA